MTRSTGLSGLILRRIALQRLSSHSRIAARSTTAGTPVKSLHQHASRAEAISRSALPRLVRNAAIHLDVGLGNGASVSWRSRFSSSTFSDTGRREDAGEPFFSAA